jgi:hypothetical protein
MFTVQLVDKLTHLQYDQANKMTSWQNDWVIHGQNDV